MCAKLHTCVSQLFPCVFNNAISTIYVQMENMWKNKGKGKVVRGLN
jgi:hypothetical protein